MRAALIGVVCLGAVVAAAQSPRVFRAGAETVPVFVTVSDRAGRLVTNLPRDAFQIYDDGVPQPMVAFDDSIQPIRLVVLLDVSGSMKFNLSLLRTSCEALLRRLWPSDVARVGTFGDEVKISPAFSRDPDQLLAGIPKFISPFAETPLWRAVDLAMNDLDGGEGRPVILVMSDGKDSEERPSLEDVRSRAERENVMIYAVGLQSRGAFMGTSMLGSYPDLSLRGVAVDSGGGYAELWHDDPALFDAIVDELHHQYLLAFAPRRHDGKDHRIEVKLTRTDLKARARRRYRAE